MKQLLRDHAQNWAPAITGLLLGITLGMMLANTFGRVQMDSGFVGFVGAIIGAGLTTFGAIWVAMHQAGASDRSLQRFVADAISAIRDEAHILSALVERGDAGDDLKEYGSKLLNQLVNLEEALSLFQKNVAVTATSNYTVRLWMNRLENTVRGRLATIEKEMKWLGGTKTRAVVDNARADLGAAAADILEACEEAMRHLNYSKDLPTSEAVDRALSRLSTDQ